MVTLVTDQTYISDAESITGWTGDTFELEPDTKTQGSNSVACAQTTNGNNEIYFALTNANLSGTHIRLQFNISFVGNMAASNPIQVFMNDGTNTQYVTYFTSSTQYSGGWVDLVVDTALFNTLTLTSIDQVGVRVVTASKPRNVPQNTWVDNWRYSNYLQIESTTTEAVDFAAAAAEDAVQVYKLLNNVDDVMFAAAEIRLGSTGSSNCNFVSNNETLVFPDRNVSSTLYALTTQQGTGTTDIDISGLVCKTVDIGQKAEINFNSSLNSLSLVNSSFIAAGTITMTPTVTTPTFSGNSFTSCEPTTMGIDADNCTWNSSKTVTVNSGVTLTNCTFSDVITINGVAVSVSSLDDLDGCTFEKGVVSSHAVDLGTVAASTTMGWNCIDSGYGAVNSETITVNVASGQTLTINVASGATTPTVENTGPGSVNVVSGQVTLTVTVIDIDTGVPIENARVYVTAAAGGSLSEGTVIINKLLTNASGQVSDTRSYSTNQPIVGRVRYAPDGGPYYKTGSIAGTVSNASDTALTVQMIPD